MAKYGVSTNPIFMPGNVEPRYSEFVTFIGVSVDHDTNTNYYMNATLAYKRACLNAIEYLKTFGYSGEQAYLLLGSAPIEGRISGIVDIPNACASLYLPTAIFDFDIRPTADGPQEGRPGAVRRHLLATSGAAGRPEHHPGRLAPPRGGQPRCSDSGGERNTMAVAGAPRRAAEGWATMAQRNPAVGVVDTLLRGVGQVMFQNNPLTGLLFLVGIFVNSFKFGGAGLLGLAASTLAASSAGHRPGADPGRPVRVQRHPGRDRPGLLLRIRRPAGRLHRPRRRGLHDRDDGADQPAHPLGHAGADRPVRAHHLAAAVRRLPVRLPPAHRPDRPTRPRPGGRGPDRAAGARHRHRRPDHGEPGPRTPSAASAR